MRPTATQLITGSIVGQFAASALGRSVLESRPFSLPVSRKTGIKSTLPVLSGGYARGISSAKVIEVEDGGFWFANFTVGASPSLEILIDSGSSDAIMNPGVYKPSANSQNLNKTFQVSYATTNPDGSGTETATGPEYKDVIGLPGTSLSVSAQTLGAITSPQSPPTFPHDGLIGFAGISSLGLDATSWFQSLCNAGTVSPCRFGLAFKTDNTGTQYFGSLPTDVYNGSLSTAPIIDEWGLEGDVVVNGKVVQSSATILTDSGTTVVFGPVASVQAIFKAAGIQYVTNNGSNGTPTTVDGYYPCDQPPKLGFAFPSASQAGTGKASKTSTIFNIDSVPLAQTMNGNNCTAILHGTDEFSFWLVGQAFFQGKYIDHNVADQTMGFANLN